MLDSLNSLLNGGDDAFMSTSVAQEVCETPAKIGAPTSSYNVPSSINRVPKERSQLE